VLPVTTFDSLDQSNMPSAMQFEYLQVRNTPQIVPAIEDLIAGQLESCCIVLQRARSESDSSLLAALHIWALTLNGEIEAAQRIMKAAVSEFEVGIHLAYAGAVLNEELENFELALSLYRDLNALHPDANLLQSCARTSLASGEFQACVNYLDQLLIARSLTPELMIMRASAFAGLGRHRDAMVVLQSLLDEWPQDPELLRQAAFISYDLAADATDTAVYFESAILLKKLTEVDPQNAQAFFYLGRSFAATDAANEAISAYMRAIELEPGNVAASHDLSALHIAYNDMQNARQVLVDLLRQPIASADRRQTESILSKIK
jgi:tetratricopeptide (TPR) repeat protein